MKPTLPRIALPLLAALLCAGHLSAPAQAALPQLSGSVDLAGRGSNAVVDGAATSDGRARSWPTRAT